MCTSVYLARAVAYIIRLPPPIRTSPSDFFIAPIDVLVGTPRAGPRAGLPAGRPCEDEHRKMRVIKGKIFLCPAIGGCRGNTRATSASNYFQTLRIERALLRTARIARHTHFSRISRSPCPRYPTTIFVSPRFVFPSSPSSRFRGC